MQTSRAGARSRATYNQVNLPKISDNSSILTNSTGYFSSDSGEGDLNGLLGSGGAAVNAMASDLVQYQEEISMMEQLYVDSLQLAALSHSLLADLRRTIGISPRITLSTMKAYGVVALNSRDGLIFPRHTQRRTDVVGGQPSPSGMKVVRQLLRRDDSLPPFTEETFPRNRFGGLFGFHLIEPDQTSVVCCASEVDAMAVYQDTKRAALALPRNVTDLAPDGLAYFDQFDSIILWFPPDQQSFSKARKFAARFGQERCHYIKPQDKLLAPSDHLQDGKSVQAILSAAEPILSKTIETFATLRSSVYDEMANKDQKAGVKWRRFPKLTEILKGFRPGEMTILTGPTGSGKTTLLSEYSLDLCEQGINTLWGSFEISNARLARMMLKQHAKVDIEKQLDDRFNIYADKLERLPMFFMRFYGATNVSTVADTIQHAIYMHDIQHVVIDNLQFMMGMQFDNNADRFFKQDRFIDRFRQIATESGVHVSIVLHPRQEAPKEELSVASVFGGAKAAQDADNILILQHVPTDIHPFMKKYLQVVKNRYDGELMLGDSANLIFDKTTLSFHIGRLRPSNANKLQD